MKLAFICHKWHGDTQYEEQTRAVCRKLVIEGKVIPVSTALMFNSFLNDNISTDRNAGIHQGLIILEKCDIFYLYGDGGISEGMKVEIETASNLKIPIEVKNEM